MDDQVMLRIEIARLMRMQREQQLAECDGFLFNMMERGAATKHVTTQLAKDAVDTISHPLESAPVKATIGTIMAAAAVTKKLIAPFTTSARSSTAGENIEEDTRTVTKIEMLEKQLEELKKLMEMQQQLHALQQLQALNGSAAPAITAMGSSTRSITSPTRSIHTIGTRVSNTRRSFPRVAVAVAETPLKRPNMVSMIEQARTVQLRHASEMEKPKEKQPESGNLQSMLRVALDRKFAQARPVIGSPGSEDSGFDSNFGSPQSGVYNRRQSMGFRKATTSAAVASRRTNRNSIGSERPAEHRKSGAFLGVPIPHAITQMSQNNSPAASPRKVEVNGNNGLAVSSSNVLGSPESVSFSVPQTPARPNFLAGIQSFKKSELHRVDAKNSEHGSTDSKETMMSPTSKLSFKSPGPAPAGNLAAQIAAAAEQRKAKMEAKGISVVSPNLTKTKSRKSLVSPKHARPANIFAEIASFDKGKLRPAVKGIENIVQKAEAKINKLKSPVAVGGAMMDISKVQLRKTGIQRK